MLNLPARHGARAASANPSASCSTCARSRDSATRAFARPRRSCASCAKLPPDADNDFTLSTADQIIATFDGISARIGLATVGLAGVSLLIGAIGIANVMFISVTERTREIGLRMALGARRGEVLLQFLLEAVFLSGLGGVAGVATALGIGLLLTFVVQGSPPWRPPGRSPPVSSRRSASASSPATGRPGAPPARPGRSATARVVAAASASAGSPLRIRQPRRQELRARFLPREHGGLGRRGMHRGKAANRELLRLERFEDPEQLRDGYHVAHAFRQAQQLEVAVAPPQGDVLGDQGPHPRAIDVVHILEIDEDLDAPFSNQAIDALGAGRCRLRRTPAAREDREW